MVTPRFIAVWLSLLLVTMAAKAHDPLQSTVDGLLRPEGLEITVTMARSAADVLLGPKGVEAGKEALNTTAAELCKISTSAGPLKLRDSKAKLTVENDVEFRLFFPHPPAGKLDLALPYLVKMPDGHCATVIFSGEANEALAVKDVWPEDAPLGVPIPPSPSP